MIKILVGLVSLAGMAYSLDLESAKEGPCLSFKPATNINMTWITNAVFPYILAGSKYHLYRIALANPQLSKIREHEFYYEACLQTYVNVSTGVGITFGFGGGIISNYDVRVSPVEHGVLNFIPVSTSGEEDVAKHTVTLTDNESFVFFANCWMGSDQRSWDLVSTTPYLSKKTKRMIEDHAESLGFQTDQMVFLKYDSCCGINIPDDRSNNPSEKKTERWTFQASSMKDKMNRSGSGRWHA